MLETKWRVLDWVRCVGFVSLLANCSAEQPPPVKQGKQTGVQLKGTAAFTILSGESAQLSATPAPAAYAQCVVCHANAGQGISLLAPEIRHAPAAYLSWVARNGRAETSMIPFPQAMLPDADVSAITAWLAALPKPTTGPELYRDFCGNCHGPMGGGGSVPVAVQGLATATLIQQVRAGAGTDPGMRGTFMPPESATELTDNELALIATFLGSK